MPHPLVMEASEVAELLGVAVATLPQKARRLQQRHHFPPSIPGRAFAWSRGRVEAWLEDPAGGGAVRTSRREAALARQRAALEEKYGVRA